MEDSVVSGDFSQSANCVNGDLESYSPQQCDDEYVLCFFKPWW